VSAAISRDDVLTRLAQGIRQLTSSEAWTAWLQMQSRFYRYSFGNTLLIGLQRPDATQVAGFHRWKSLGRSVRKGSRGIAILAPVVRRVQVREEDTEDVSIFAAAPSAFRIVYVFDVADTEGRELPTVPCHPLRGDAPAMLFERLAKVGESRGFTVGMDAMADSRANGDTAFGDRRIRVRDTLAPAQRVKTLAHELGHALLHEDANDRALAELEAESVAFVVCDAVGLASDDYSFGYVATWVGGDADSAEAALRASGGRITRAARTVLDEVSGSLEANPEAHKLARAGGADLEEAASGVEINERALEVFAGAPYGGGIRQLR
jgi:DNA primase